MAKDAEKYFELVLNIYPDLERFSLFLTKSRQNAKELLNEAIVRGYAGFQRLKSEQAFLSYMFTVIKRTYYELKRSRWKSKIDEDIELDELYSKEISPDVLADIKILYEALDRLKSNDRELLILSELTELPYNEIAKILNVSENNVKIRVFRAKNKLKMLLQDEPVNV